MDNPIGTLLKPEVFAALTGAPFLLQWLKRLVPGLTGQWAALLTLGVVAAMVLTTAWNACPWPCMVGQVLLGWIYVELIYTRVVEPMSKSSNPLVPDA